MIKLAVFDVDNTLTLNNENMKRENVLKLRRIKALGVKVALVSGKPTAYLAGFARMLGIKDLIIAGENGLEVNFGFAFPPISHHPFKIDAEQLEQLKVVREEIESLNLNIFYQPNKIGITPFFLDEKAKEELNEYAQKKKESNLSIDIYIHDDCIDFTPSNVSKGMALDYLAKHYELDYDEIIAIGDSSNDISMLERVEQSLIVGNKINLSNATRFNSTSEMLDYILEQLENNHEEK